MLNVILLLCFIFTSNLLSIEKVGIFKQMKILLDSEIILTIKGKNTQQILNNKSIEIYDDISKQRKNYEFNINPSEILINGKKTDIIDFYVYNLASEENKITIRFNTTLTNCNVMFTGLSNITNIIFINFDFSRKISLKGMFYSCKNLISLNLGNFDLSSVTNMDYMFYCCYELISLDLSNSNTINTNSMNNMFYSCYKLISLNLRNFKTSSVISMGNMFENCYSLISLDLNNFNTSSVTDIQRMFLNCKNLISLNLSNFITSSVNDMSAMFYGCMNLITLDLSNFDISSVNDISSMFYNCINLISLDLGNFDISSVTCMSWMFYNCSNLILLDLSNFGKSSVTDIKVNSMFELCNSNLIYCINIIIIIFFIKSILLQIFYFSKNSNSIFQNIITQIQNDIPNSINNCYSICFENNKKIIYNDRKCEYNCTEINKFNYNNICNTSCPKGTHNISANKCIKDNTIVNYDISTTINFEDITNSIIISSIPFYYSISLNISNTIYDYKLNTTIINYNDYMEYFNNIINSKNLNNTGDKDNII